MYFNYCKFATWPEDSIVDQMQTFAYVVDTATNIPTAVYTNNSILPPKTEFHLPNYDLGESESWLTITQTSYTPCIKPDEFIKFQTEILCDENIKEDGGAKVISADTSPDEDCTVKVKLAH